MTYNTRYYSLSLKTSCCNVTIAFVGLKEDQKDLYSLLSLHTLSLFSQASTTSHRPKLQMKKIYKKFNIS
ncbi:unnamed protein product [Lathyrus oleraceus]